ncbi:MAG: hypothetical protein FJ009_20885 [Chloroflexi bacterium]|nr:hypothetical protein [Chloroflexota bacterium]
MAFTVSEMHDLTQLLVSRPDWLAEVRRIVLTQELLALPELVRELAHAQARTEARVEELAHAQARTEARVEELAHAQARTEARVEELAHAQARTEARLDALTARVDALTAQMAELAQAQFDVTTKLSELAAAQARTEQAVLVLADNQKRMENTLSQLVGDNLERKYRERAGVYFGKWLKSIQVVSPNDLRDDLETRLPEEQVDDVMLTDALIRGRVRQVEGLPEIWLVLEVSRLIDRNDVSRAERRAAILRRAGYRAMPVVAGEEVHPGYEGAVEYSQVAVFLDGRRQYWDRAVAAALSSELE